MCSRSPLLILCVTAVDISVEIGIFTRQRISLRRIWCHLLWYSARRHGYKCTHFHGWRWTKSVSVRIYWLQFSGTKHSTKRLLQRFRGARQIRGLLFLRNLEISNSSSGIITLRYHKISFIQLIIIHRTSLDAGQTLDLPQFWLPNLQLHTAARKKTAQNTFAPLLVHIPR